MPSNAFRRESLFRSRLLLAVLLALPAAVSATEPHEIVGHLGQYAVLNSDKGEEIGVEVRFSPRRFRIQPKWLPDLEPQGGVMATGGGSLYVYAGFGCDIDLGKNWFFRPSWGAGLFHDDQERDLGGVVEFRSALELTKQVSRRIRLGMTFYHLSNAKLYHDNPGVESLVFTFSARP